MSFLKIDMEETFSKALMEKLAEAGPRAAHAVAVQIAKDTEPFVPARNKSLVNRTQVVDNMVIYPGPYARFLYYGKLMIDPDTGSPFARLGATKEVTGTDLDIKTDVHSLAQSHWYEASRAMNKKKWVKVAEKAVERELKKRK